MTDYSQKCNALVHEIKKIIVGQDDTIQHMIIALLCKGHVLLEGLPGVAKTTLIKTLAKALGVDTKRVQFTPDLLPSDLIGSQIYNPKTHEFDTKKGPLFTNIVLADEINRAPAKVQSALLEAMQERQITIGSHSFTLQEPFLVFATQNPVDQEGTYTLPEAQIDRFLLKLILDYPSLEQEKAILQTSRDNFDDIICVMSHEDIINAQEHVLSLSCDEKIIDYIARLICATRKPQAYGCANLSDYIAYGASPRATRALLLCSKAHALLENRAFVIPDDVKAVAHAVLEHRIVKTFKAQADGISSRDIINTILKTVKTP